MQSDRVSLTDIAARAGVSRMTVSLVLRDDGRISRETRERVRALAAELGYKPNPRIGALMSETVRTRHSVPSEVLAVVTCEPTRDGWTQFDPCGTYNGIEQRAAEYGYRVEPWWIADPQLPPARTNRILFARGIRGIIIPNISRQFFTNWSGTLPINWNRFSVVEIGGGLRTPEVNQVLHDHYTGMFTALDELEKLGYRRIGLCLRSEDDLRAHHRWTGAYSVWLALRGNPAGLRPLVVDELQQEEVCRWIRGSRLEAVISLRDLDLEAWGFSVPADIGYAALHVWGEHPRCLSGIDQRDSEIAAAVVDLLVNQLRRNERGCPDSPVRWLLRGRWIAGETTRQVRVVKRPKPGIENEWLHRTSTAPF